jgi:glycosyltransferase involved in cell wall biosynthesis
MKTALILSTYPLKKAFHGGQVRLNELKKAYQRAGLEVISIAVYEPESYANNEVSAGDIAFPQDSPHRLFNGKSVPFITDLMSGVFLTQDSHAWDQFQYIHSKKNLAVIHFEQPWLLPAVQKLKAENNLEDTIIIFGSQNVESRLKQEIFNQYSIPSDSVVQRILSVIKKREIDAAAFSDLTIVVTEEDEMWFKQHSKNTKLLRIPNGVRDLFSDQDNIEKMKSVIQADKWVTYVASAHPPNFDGFYKCIGDSLACIPPDGKLVLAGSVADHLIPYLRTSSMRCLNESRIHSFGRVSTKKLDSLVLSSHALLLPITAGGGSNLKTAEAIIAGKYVIGTQKAFRGYEDFLSLKGVVLADNKEHFRLAISNVFEYPVFKRSIEERKMASQVLWDNVVQPLVKYIQERTS